MLRISLRQRFGIAAVLLVCTTVMASMWTFVALSRLSGVVTDTVRDSEAVTAVTSKLSGALEREDDAVLLVLAGEAQGRAELARERTVVDRAVGDLFDVLGPVDEQELATPLKTALEEYRQAADAVIPVASAEEALGQYHERANPLLRRAVNLTTVIRDRHFTLARQAVTTARDEAASSRRAVLFTTVVALAFAVLVSWHLTNRIVTPLRRLTRGADAIRRGEFDERIDLRSGDELGELAAAFNDMATDLAEFRRTNVREMIEAKQALEATLEALPDAVLLLAPDGRILSMNRMAQATCRAAHLATPATLHELHLEGLDHATILEALRTASEVGLNTDLTRTVQIERQGRRHRLLPRVVHMPTTGAPHGAILLLSDVTELARVDEMRSELVAVASHELQTPLTTLRMTLLMLQEAAAALPAREQELIATSLMGVEQLNETVHEFLDLTRIEAGELRLALEPVQLTRLLAEVVGSAEAQAAGLGVSMERAVASNLPPLAADRPRLRIVFDNLLSNALKYTPRGGAIRVEATFERPSGDARVGQVAISVHDTGPGIPREYRERVFEKFFRLEHQHLDDRRTARGAGIGLYMCRQIVELHGGRIRCTTGDGEIGTRITVQLPVRQRVFEAADALAPSA
ncbi:ATP-binding protein [Luteitalea sp.]|uniref:sensor histidine kinase n=1 Tax=Luteitalea sp. TaxID=2004800 RepID=UPI0025C5346A|nr:ATP-binding protein [Luteitalea sp.]